MYSQNCLDCVRIIMYVLDKLIYVCSRVIVHCLCACFFSSHTHRRTQALAYSSDMK